MSNQETLAHWVLLRHGKKQIVHSALYMREESAVRSVTGHGLGAHFVHYGTSNLGGTWGSQNCRLHRFSAVWTGFQIPVRLDGTCWLPVLDIIAFCMIHISKTPCTDKPLQVVLSSRDTSTDRIYICIYPRGAGGCVSTMFTDSHFSAYIGGLTSLRTV
jgi:hypothetical protein